MKEIEITFDDGRKFYFRYLEEVAVRLTKIFHSEVLVTDLESLITSTECDFEIFGITFHYKQR